ALGEQVSQMDLGRVNEETIAAWQERAPRADFELGLWEGPYPEEALPVVAAMMQAINLAPRGDLDLEDFVWTPEILRQRDASMVERGVERWCLYARQRDTGTIAGYTQ